MKMCALFILSTLAVPLRAQYFTDVAEEAGVAFQHKNVVDVYRQGIGTGAAWIDFDRDGELDLYVTQGRGANALYRNNGDGTFTDVAAQVGAADATHAGSGVAAADYDNDGWMDLYLANADGDVLLKNDSGRAFIDVTRPAGLSGQLERGTAAAWGDYDGDGFLDLYVVNHMATRGPSASSRDRLFHSEGGTTFTDVTDLLHPTPLGAFGFAATWTDFDVDGDADLFLVNDCGFADSTRSEPSRLYRNDGGTHPHSWSFTEVGEEVGAAYCRHGMGVAAADYDGDGWIDYFYTNIGRRTTLLDNDGGLFTDLAADAGVLVGFDPRTGGPFSGTYSWGANFFDYDLDGRPDLYVTAGTLALTTSSEVDPQPNVLFRNRGDGTFEDVSVMSGADIPHRSRTSIVGDYDRDGDPDLFVVNSNETAALFRNESVGGHYLILDLSGTAANRNGIGARIRITTPDGRSQHHEVRSGSSLGGGDDVAAYFGLGRYDQVSEIDIAWPSGTFQTLSNVAADRRITIEERSASSSEHEAIHSDLVLDVFPNPFHPPVHIAVGPDPAAVQIFDIMGREIRRFEGVMSRISWDGRAADRQPASPGVYVVRALAGAHVKSRVIVLL